MRIVALNRDSGISPDRHKGAAIHVVAMRDAFERLGHEVVALDEHRDDHVLAALERMLETGPIDLVYERYAIASSRCAGWLHKHNIAHVLEVNAPLVDEECLYRSGSTRVDQRRDDAVQFGNAALVVAVSPETAQYAVGRGARVSRTLVLPNGIDERIFHSRGRPEPECRTFHGEIFPNATILGFHGRLRPWHNFEALVAVAQALQADGHLIHIIAAGEGSFAELLAPSLPASSFSVFPWVSQSELGDLVRCFDILPLTYSPDAPCYFSPLKLSEAMACGVVPVVPRLGNLAEIVGDGHNGLIFESDHDGKNLISAILRLATDSQLRNQMSANAALTGASRTWVGIAEAVLAGLENRS